MILTQNKPPTIWERIKFNILIHGTFLLFLLMFAYDSISNNNQLSLILAVIIMLFYVLAFIKLVKQRKNAIYLINQGDAVSGTIKYVKTSRTILFNPVHDLFNYEFFYGQKLYTKQVLSPAGTAKKHNIFDTKNIKVLVDTKDSDNHAIIISDISYFNWLNDFKPFIGELVKCR